MGRLTRPRKGWAFLFCFFLLFGGIVSLGYWDVKQTEHSLMRGYWNLAQTESFKPREIN
jgi:hypothetical protein